MNRNPSSCTTCRTCGRYLPRKRVRLYCCHQCANATKPSARELRSEARSNQREAAK